MRRIALWFASTVAVLMLLAGYHTSFAGPLAVTSTTSVYSTGVLADPATSGPSTAPAAGSGTTSGSAGSGSTDGTAASTTVTGDTVQTRWGPVQVEVGVAGSRITGVSVLQYPDDNPEDVRINDYALPILVDATMTAQGADIDMVSGATYTSVGYQQSLQSALDRAGL
ncbi:FMN-binding protein [Nocardioides terrigena]|uniref:FMN-binding protein n=1 Tax=Nocardioides terrigena TaxID=424797 RepID=UPI000D2F7903|nr:FMN-binding protein [Nocardioides terrigena]